jgi:hypothetical protein
LVVVYGLMIGNLAGLYFLRERFAVVMASGWLLAVLLACVRAWINRRRGGTGRGIGQVILLGGFAHWIAVAAIASDLVSRRRT